MRDGMRCPVCGYYDVTVINGKLHCLACRTDLS